MGTPYVGEIRMFAGNFPPAGWAFCDGQLVPIAENETLFNLIGTTYGGDGQETFALPDLRGRIPIHQGSGHTLAEQGGAETVTLTPGQMPSHTHPLGSASPALLGDAGGNLPGAVATQSIYRDGVGTTVPMATAASQPVGGSQPHENLMPYLCVSFIISLLGIFPSPT